MIARPEVSPIPSGWNHNPSSRSHRNRLLPFALAGLLAASYLALCQLGVLGPAWDPLFRDGTDQVIHSSISRAFPIPDALLGAFAYLVELIFIVLGGEDRWLRRPWLAILSGLTVLALGATSVVLLFLQPVVVHAWCTWCLLSALMSLILLQRSLPELLASFQTWVLLWRKNNLPPLWLFRGMHSALTPVFRVSDDRARVNDAFPWTAATHGVPTLYASAFLGAATLALPDLFHLEGVARITFALCGATGLASSVIAMCDPVRFLRWINGMMGSLLFFWFLGEPLGALRWIAGIIGLAWMLLCLYRGKAPPQYGFFTSPSEAQRQLDRGISKWNSLSAGNSAAI